MGKVGRPLRLIDFVSDVNVARRAGGQPTIRKLVRARTVIYAALLGLVATVMVVTLATRSQWSMNVLHDRAPLYITLSDGSLRNGYTVKVLNKTRRSEEHTSELQSLMRISYAAFCLN